MRMGTCAVGSSEFECRTEDDRRCGVCEFERGLERSQGLISIWVRGRREDRLECCIRSRSTLHFISFNVSRYSTWRLQPQSPYRRSVSLLLSLGPICERQNEFK